MAEPDWSQLPTDLLALIASRLPSSSFDRLRFRSTCATWRASDPTQPHTRPDHLPNRGISTVPGGFRLLHRPILRLSTPDPDHHHWIIILMGPDPTRPRLLHPLSARPLSFPAGTLDLSRVRVQALAQELVLEYVSPPPYGPAASLYMEKAVLREDEGFVVLTIHVSGRLALFRSGRANWEVIDHIPSPYDDVALFRGGLYAADATGRCVEVVFENEAPGVRMVAESVFGGDKKYLVECGGELMLLDAYLSVGSVEEEEEEEVEEEEEGAPLFMKERILKFKVYKLDWKGRRWDPVESLGEWVLFLGENSAFAASPPGLPLCRGNSIVIMGREEEAGQAEFASVSGCGVSVFCLDDGSFRSLASLSKECGSDRLFWEPPEWVASVFSPRVSNFLWVLHSMAFMPML